MTIPVTLLNRQTIAVIDSAAHVTVVNENIFTDLTGREKVKLNAAKNSFMLATVVKNVSIIIGDKLYHWGIYAAPISDQVQVRFPDS